jgi:hypothetical protein
MSSPQGSSRKKTKKWLHKTATVGQKPTDATHIEQRPQPHKGNGELQTSWHSNAKTLQVGHQLACAATTANNMLQTTPYKPTTFYTID